MSNTRVQLTIDKTHAAITFVTEEGLNVLSSSVLREFGEVLTKLKDQAGVRTTAVAAEGKVFIAGADIKEMANFSRQDARAYGALGQAVFNELASLSSITVAAINGAAMGGGLEMALACDFRIAVASAKLALPETSLALTPGWGGIGRLTRLIGPARAKRLFLSATPVLATEGVAFGLVDEVVDAPEALPARVGEFCKSFVRASPMAAALAKRACADGDDLSAFADCFETEESRAGIAAFLQKRNAPWME